MINLEKFFLSQIYLLKKNQYVYNSHLFKNAPQNSNIQACVQDNLYKIKINGNQKFVLMVWVSVLRSESNYEKRQVGILGGGLEPRRRT